ncbi:PKD domain-containing protein, partial [Arthrospira platensis SPKY1]|nr:PKD domain-containing protein [Arthrospira platensis SPKY1]
AFSPAQAELDLSSGSNEISFVDESTGATAWLWSFGDGTFSTEQNPVHAYEAAGTYLVTLTTTGTDGCSNSASGTVAVTGSLISSTSFVPEIGTMTLFPNPAQDIVFVAFELKRPAAVA